MKKAIIIIMTVVLLTNTVTSNYAMAENKFFTEGGYGGGGSAEALTISGLLALFVTLMTQSNAVKLPNTKQNVDYLKEVIKDDFNNNKDPDNNPKPNLPYFDELSNYIVRKDNMQQSLKNDLMNNVIINNLDDYVLKPDISIKITLADRIYIANHLMTFNKIESLEPNAPIKISRDMYLIKTLSDMGYSQNAINTIDQEYLNMVNNEEIYDLTMLINNNNILKIYVVPRKSALYGGMTTVVRKDISGTITRAYYQKRWGYTGDNLNPNYRLSYRSSDDVFTRANSTKEINENFIEYVSGEFENVSLVKFYNKIIYSESVLSYQDQDILYTRPPDVPIGGRIEEAQKAWNIPNLLDDVVINNNRHLKTAFEGKNIENNTTEEIAEAIEVADINGKKVGEPVVNNIETDVNMEDEPLTGNILQRVLTWLFKPKTDKLEAFIEHVEETFDNQAGLLTYPLTLVIEFLMKVSNLEPGDCIIDIPPINYKGHELFGGVSFNFTEFIHKQEFDGVYMIYIFIVDFIMIIAVLNLAAKKGDEILRGN